MGKGGKFWFKHSTTRKARTKNMKSDESDEDYTMEENEECGESDEYCSSLDGEASEESLGEFEEEQEEEEDEKKVKKVVRSKTPRRISNRKRNGFQKLRKKKKVSYKEDDDDDGDYEEDDDEFTPDEFDCVDDEEELSVMKKKRQVGRPCLNEKGLARGRKRKRNFNVLRSPTGKKPRTKRRLREAISSNDGKSPSEDIMVEQKSKKTSGTSRRRLVKHSDSDFESSGSSDYEFTISEEEREQVREANEFCRSLVTSLRSSSQSKRLQERLALCQQRKRPHRKGKGKTENLKNEVGKQVCGICLSEEGEKTLRGTLNCCSHYFCFACIMEWSKVESRCPLCKQRFMTISKPARSDTGFDLRTVVIQVPELDQVYQPSEEELRDPYENVICTECLQGGDDALMLLCDLCDSPAHTYCVGLGHEVPEGNWYCEGCRPTALGSSNAQNLNHTPDRRRSNATPDRRRSNDMSNTSTDIDPAGGGIDLNVMYVPDTPLTQESGSYPSRRPVGDFQTASPTSGSGAFTVSERRRIQRQIHNILNNRLSQSAGRSNGISANSLFGFQIGRGRELATQHMMAPERVASQHTSFEPRFHDNSTPLVQNRDYLPATSGHSRGQVNLDPIPTSADASVAGILQAELTGINSRLNYDRLHP